MTTSHRDLDALLTAVLDLAGSDPAGFPGDVAPRIDVDTKSVMVKASGPWIVSLAPQIFNLRVLLSHEDQWPHTWTSGFCYDPGPAPILAALAWDPMRQPRPAGFKKVAAEDLRLWESICA